ncbi:hypothetical protein RFI_13976 [Reticulomyxa filosa]|uniref:RING-type domain-containing protein n=1 Tax=Reticulomyxa filosa TaxID=46433 RepID=X6ND09_RETFI|nr:hypothetical protein RFI_13976 [Reticulomyxa filosa]|eukprot:ETO23212.1 hypothetical protein RFI_13976 [Reticulomyxa filosa]
MTTQDVSLKQLEEDLNHGDPLDLMQYQKLLQQASELGFSTADTLEAALVCNTHELELVTDYILQDPTQLNFDAKYNLFFILQKTKQKSRRKRYEKRKEELKKDVEVAPEKLKLIDELKRLRRELEQEKRKQEQLEQELKERQSVKKVEKYTEFLRGVIADEIITDQENLALEAYRKVHSINDEEQEQALSNLEMRSEDLEDYRKNPEDGGGRKCVACGKGPKEYVVYDCMHVCVCESCSKNVGVGGGPGDGCPVCGGDIVKVEKQLKTLAYILSKKKIFQKMKSKYTLSKVATEESSNVVVKFN